jgi:hypothetical protein
VSSVPSFIAMVAREMMMSPFISRASLSACLAEDAFFAFSPFITSSAVSLSTDSGAWLLRAQNSGGVLTTFSILCDRPPVLLPMLLLAMLQFSGDAFDHVF